MEGKAKLEFNLPEQRESFMLAVNGEELALFILEVKQELRAKRKYNMDAEDTKKWTEFENFFNAFLSEYRIDHILEYVR